MRTITVEGIPDGLLARLRLAAEGSGRSLSREVVVQLARSVARSREAPRAVTRVAGARAKRMLTDRNLNWVPKIRELVNGKKTVIVIVGAGHLVGREGVVELLKKEGLKVTQQ